VIALDIESVREEREGCSGSERRRRASATFQHENSSEDSS